MAARAEQADRTIAELRQVLGGRDGQVAELQARLASLDARIREQIDYGEKLQASIEASTVHLNAARAQLQDRSRVAAASAARL